MFTILCPLCSLLPAIIWTAVSLLQPHTQQLSEHLMSSDVSFPDRNVKYETSQSLVTHPSTRKKLYLGFYNYKTYIDNTDDN